MMRSFIVFAVSWFLLSEALAHDTKSAQRLESNLARLTIRLGKIEAQLRTLTGKIEEAQRASLQAQTQLKKNAGDFDGQLKQVERDIVRIKNAVKALASQRPSRRRSSSSQKDSQLSAVQNNPDSLYNHALDLLWNKKNYPQAQSAFETLVKKYPDDEKAGQSLYWLGETFYLRGNYRNAASSYLRSFNSYGAGPKAMDSLLKLGISLARLNEWDEACATFDKLRANFPSTPPRILQRLNTEYERLQCDAGSLRR